jgi:amidophosphoribosyltransferase
VFQERHMLKLGGNVGLGHVRYPTAGSATVSEAQPFYVNSPYGICLAHNGNLVNAEELKRLVTQQDHRHLNTDSDSETLLNVFAHELGKPAGNGLKPDQILDAVEALYKRCSGGYAVVAMIIGYGVVAFRDPHGIRPLVLGVRETAKGVERMVASESVALDAVGFELERDVLPGEAVFIDKRGFLHSRQTSARRGYTPCIFEFVYFARPDSIIDNLSVYKARMRMGEKLADKILRVRPDHDIDVVIPIPDTSRTAALQVATRLGVKYREGFIKNRYIGRTFIMPEQSARRASVRRKLNAIGLEFNRKNVLLVDDSIVRGTTSQQIIDMAREAGARKVYFASAAPPVRYPNVYGIDMPAAGELVAAGRTVEQVQRKIGADWLVYQDLEDLKQAVHHEKADIDGFDTSCFNGEYVTGDVSRAYLDALEIIRANAAKAKRDAKVRAEETDDDTMQVASGL